MKEGNKLKANLDNIKAKIKENIHALINSSNIEGAKDLIEQYRKFEPDDLEIYAMDAIVAIMEGRLDEAEVIIENGLQVNRYSFDLMFNLGYVYEQKCEYNKALIQYKKTLRTVYYDISLRSHVEKEIEFLNFNKSKELENERSSNIIFKQLENVSSILFVNFGSIDITQNMAEKLIDCAIDVDLATNIDNFGELPYRKCMGFSSIENLVGYINNYQYDVIHMIDLPEKFKPIMSKSKSSFLFQNKKDFENKDIYELIDIYSQAKGKSLNSKSPINKVNSLDSYVNDSDLTIVIPTHNRPQYLPRVLNFINSYKYIKSRVIILDSSTEDIKELNIKTIRKMDNIRFEYHKFNNDINPSVKFLAGFEMVKTSFMCMCADDDFEVEEGIIKSLEILNRRKDLFSVKGKNLYFINTMSQLREYDFFAGLYEEDSLQRLETLVKGFVPSLFYQVFKTKEIYNLYYFFTQNYNILPSNPVFAEYTIYFMAVITGKIGTINIDFNVRDKDAFSENQSVKNFPHAVMDGSFNEDYHKFRRFLQKYSEYINIFNSDYQQRMDLLFSGFLENFLGISKNYIDFKNDKFDLTKLEKGMRKSWVWRYNI